MSVSRVTLIKNGDIMQKFYHLTCDDCEVGFPESSPHHQEGNKHFCVDCAFVRGDCSEKDYMSACGLGMMKDAHVVLVEGKPRCYIGKKNPFENTVDMRRTADYRKWRTKVFDRDGNQCVECGSKERLHSHHIKPYAKYPKLRLELSNGTTLCEPCHREKHRVMSG